MKKMRRLFIACWLCCTVVTQAQHAFQFTAIPWSAPDIVSPFRGPERWHNMLPNQVVNYPTEEKNIEPLDAYFRSGLSWDKLEKSEGQYDWKAFDDLINSCIDRGIGQKFAFNIMTLHPGATDGIKDQEAYMHYPMYVHKRMQADGAQQADWISKSFDRASNWVPNWNHPYFLSRVEALLQALGTHIKTTSYKKVPYWKAISYIDIGIFGCWGEWNHSGIVKSNDDYPAGRQATAASLIRIIDAYRNAFPDLPLVAIMHVFDGNQFPNVMVPPEVGYYALTTANRWGKLGYKRMNWGRGFESYIRATTIENKTVYKGLRFDTAIQNRWKYAPVNGEGPNYGTAEQGRFPFYNMRKEVKDYHASQIANGNWGDGKGGDESQTASAEAKEALRNAWKMAGYRLILKGGSMPESVKVGEPFKIYLDWQNIGNAPNYENWMVCYELRKPDGKMVWTNVGSMKIKGFLPGAVRVTTDVVTLRDVPAGNYQLVLVIRDTNGYRQPLPLAIEGRLADGAYELRQQLTVSAK